MVDIKNYMFTYFYSQYMVLFTMVPRNTAVGRPGVYVSMKEFAFQGFEVAGIDLFGSVFKPRKNPSQILSKTRCGLQTTASYLARCRPLERSDLPFVRIFNISGDAHEGSTLKLALRMAER